MKVSLRKFLLLFLAVLASWAPAFALDMNVRNPLYAPHRYNPLFTGYENIFCTPRRFYVSVVFVHPCITEVELKMENSGTWKNVGPILRSNNYHIVVDTPEICGKVKFRARHFGPDQATCTGLTAAE